VESYGIILIGMVRKWGGGGAWKASDQDKNRHDLMYHDLQNRSYPSVPCSKGTTGRLCYAVTLQLHCSQILNFAFVWELWLSVDASGNAVLNLSGADVSGSNLARGVHVFNISNFSCWRVMTVAVV
jgi:hypothetical protein